MRLRDSLVAFLCFLATILVKEQISSGTKRPVLSESKLGIHLIAKYSSGAQKVISSGPRLIKVLDPQACSDMVKAMREYKAKFPNGIVVVRIWERTGGLHYTLSDSPEEAAKDFYKRVLEPAISALEPGDRKLIDFFEGPNEGETTPTWENIESAKWFGQFWVSLSQIIFRQGFRPCAGSIAVGNPPGTLDEIYAKLEAFLPALRKLKELKGAWSYHAYTLEYTADQKVEIWYSLRYRLFYDYLRKRHPEVADIPLILTEGGVDRGGNPRTDGWQARGDVNKFTQWLKWFDDQLRGDKYVLGCTLFQIGNPEGWPSFDLEPATQWLSNYVKTTSRPLN